MKKLTEIIKNLNESKEVIRYTNDQVIFAKYIDESLRSKPGYSVENSSKIFEDLLKMYPDNFDSAKKYFDQNFQ